jgi:hypothetical protein
MNVNRDHPNIGPRITIMNTDGERLAVAGHLGYGPDVGQFMAPHGLSLDSHDSLYVGEVAWTNANNNGLPSEGIRSFQKLVKAT